MTLNILTEYKVVSDLENYVISADMLRMATTHLFIASHKWDLAIVEISDKIPQGSLSCLRTVCADVKVSIPDKCSEHDMRLLTELFPDKAGTIRRTYMTGMSLKGVVPIC